MSLVTGVRSRTRTAPDLAPAAALAHRLPEDLAHLDVPVVPTQRQVLTGTAAWMSVVFVTVYGLLSTALDLSGLYPGLLGGWQADLAAFAVMLAGTLGVVALLRPRIELPRFTPVTHEDPVRWAVLGGFGAWAVAHSTVPGLWPLYEMPTGQLLAFTALNLVEHTLFGVMLASFVKTRRAAFALGALFSLAFLSIWMVLRVGVGL